MSHASRRGVDWTSMRAAGVTIATLLFLSVMAACSSFSSGIDEPTDAGADGMGAPDPPADAGQDARDTGADARDANEADADADADACGMFEAACTVSPDSCCAGFRCSGGKCTSL
jgi:hypothetical protein